MEDDLDVTISQLVDSGGSSIISQLLDIQKFKVRQRRSLDWAKNLTCLTPLCGHSAERQQLLRKTPVDIAGGNYVAVSYKCEDVKLESQGAAEYYVTSHGTKDSKPSTVQNHVTRRIIKYMQSFGVPSFWIDKECVNQDDPIDLEDAMQSMDLVYRCSKHSVGLLSTQIDDQDQLDLLLALVSGDLVDRRRPKLQYDVNLINARHILRLLDRLMNDPWWTRRWIFQEEYCSGQMLLLIPHAQHLLKTGWDRHSLSMPGEVLVKAAELRIQATLFCLACQDHQLFKTEKDIDLCEDVLDKIKSYKVLHDWGYDHEPAGHPMSVQILSDIVDREITKPGDTLAIIANCCGYNSRLDRNKLEQNGYSSLSLAILALCLLNGEILWSKTRASTRHATVLEFLRRQTFDRFHPPEARRQLTFMKKTRLVDAKLTRPGIQTTGHLWRPRRTIHTSSFNLDPIPVRGPHPWNKDLITICLPKLIDHLRRRGYRSLATSLNSYLKNNTPPPHIRPSAGLTQIFHATVLQLCRAILNRQDLLVVQHQTDASKWGIFITASVSRRNSLIFTAHEVAEFDELVGMNTGPDKFVSLSVDADGHTERGVPLLKVQAWVNGLIFFDGDGRGEKKVVFRWPSVLLDTGEGNG